jgi:hypothetical protein
MEAGVRLTRRVARRLEPPFFSALCRHFFAPPPAFETRAIDALERAFSSLERRALLFYPPLSLYLSLSLSRLGERETRETRSNSRKRRARDATSSARSDREGLFSIDGRERSSALCAAAPAHPSARLSLSRASERERERERDARETRSNSLSRESFGPPTKRSRESDRASPFVFGCAVGASA